MSHPTDLSTVANRRVAPSASDGHVLHYTRPEPEAQFAELFPYGMPSRLAYQKMSKETLALLPTAPGNVERQVILTEGTLTQLDRATLRALLAHEIAHMQLGHPDARLARADAQKETQQGVKTVSRAGSKAASFIPGVGGLVSKGIGTARKAATTAMEMQGNPYLPEEEQAADAMTVTLLNQAEASSCHAPTGLLEERLRAPDEDAWEAWLHAHPVSTERIEALSAPCSRAASP